MRDLFKYFLFIALLTPSYLEAQDLSLRVANQVVRNDSIVFDIEGKTNLGGEFIQDLQFYIDYSTGAFGSNVVANTEVTSEFLTLLDGVDIVLSNPKYQVVQTTDNTSSRLSIAIEAANQPGQGTPAYHNAFTTSYQGIIRFRFYIADSTKLPLISMNNTLMSAQQFYQDGSSADNQFNLTISSDLVVYPLYNYDIIWDGAAWTGGSGVDGKPSTGDAALNLLVETGQTTPVAGNASVANLIILDQGTLDLGGNTLTVTGDIIGSASGTVVNGTIEFAGSTPQEITGATSWNNITINNANGVTVDLDTQLVTGVVSLQNGTLNTSNSLRLGATDTSYAQIEPGSGSLSGDIIYEMYIAQAGWHNLASPIAGATLADLEDDISFNYSGNSNRVSAFKWDARNGDWVEAVDNTESFNAGWNIFIDNNFIPADGGVNADGNLPVIIDLVGAPNTGNFEAPLDFGSSTTWSGFAGSNTTDSLGWNLVANPYPSNLDWNQVAGDFGGQDINVFYYIWDPAAGSYVYHDGSAGSGSTAGTIAPMQAVWVKLESSAATTTAAFDFTDADRTVSNPANLLKGSLELLRLQAQHAQNGQTDNLQLIREAGFEVAYDSNGDAFQRQNGAGPIFYTISEDSTLLDLNRIPANFNGDTIMLGFNGNSNEDYIISIDENSFPQDFKVELFDRKTGTITDLKTGNYTFTNDTSFSVHRFNLYAISKNIGVEEEELTTNNPFRVITENESVRVQFSSSMKNDVTVEVVNLSGQILYSKENISPYGEHTFSFDTGLNEAYVYVVRIIDTQTEEMWSEKIIY